MFGRVWTSLFIAPAALVADNPAFRAYWHGNAKMFLNAIFFSTAFMAEGQRFAGESSDDD